MNHLNAKALDGRLGVTMFVVSGAAFLLALTMSLQKFEWCLVPLVVSLVVSHVSSWWVDPGRWPCPLVFATKGELSQSEYFGAPPFWQIRVLFFVVSVLRWEATWVAVSHVYHLMAATMTGGIVR